MNERIKELYKQAFGYFPPPTGEPELEKFAELIVMECADIAKHHVMNISTYSDADFVEKQIQEHFGVADVDR
jgi:hypothetical protein